MKTTEKKEKTKSERNGLLIRQRRIRQFYYKRYNEVQKNKINKKNNNNPID